MYDRGKVIIGIGAFFVIFATPFLYNLAIGKGDYVPLLEKPAEGSCIESTEYMRAYHMDMLNTWRDQVVREGMRTYVSSGEDKTEYNMSLTKTCLNCHSNRANFCDSCHNYEGVNPLCWSCHVTPEENK